MRRDTESSLRRLRRLLSFLVFLALPVPAYGQDIATAEALFNSGLADMKAGRYEAGCKAIAESQRLDPRPGTLFTLATCEKEWGRIATAVTRFGDYLSVFERLPEDKQLAQGERPNVARAERDRLAPEVPRMTVSLPRSAPKGTVVKRNGEILAEAALGVALPVDPGEHTFTVETPGQPATEQRIAIQRGEKKQIELRAQTPFAAAPPQRPPETKPSRSHVGPIIAFGAGAVGLGAGIGAGIAVLGQRGELDKACPDKDCPLSAQGKLDSAKTISYVSTGGFVLAGIGIAAGAVWILLPAPKTDASKKASVRLGPGYWGMEGVF